MHENANGEDEMHSRVKIQGPPNNIPFLLQLLGDRTFEDGLVTTQWIDTGGASFVPRCDFCLPVERTVIITDGFDLVPSL